MASMVDRTHAGQPGLPGRDRELALLAGVVEAARAGRRGVVLVEGDAGIGKTSLVRAALGAGGTITVWARADEDEVGVDNGIIEQLARAAPLDDAARARLVPARAVEPMDTGAVLVALLDDLSLDPRRPLAVVVDDVQWADLASLRALSFAARRLPTAPVLLVLIGRPGAAAHVPPGLARLVADDGLHLSVGPLDRAAVRRVAEEVTGRSLTAAVAERLRVHTAGNPLHLRAVLEEIGAGGLTAGGDLPAPRTYSQLVLARMASGSAAAARLVEAAAVLGVPTRLDVTAALGDVDDPAAALDEAVGRRLLADTPDGTGDLGPVAVTVAHPLVRAAVLGAMPPGRRAELHRRAGALVEGLQGLRHRLLGSLTADARLWREAIDAAAGEAARGAHGSAASLLRLAATVAADAAARDRSVLDAVDEHLTAGQVLAAAALRDSVDRAAPCARRSYVRARLAHMLGPRHAARPALEAAWRELSGSGSVDPTSRPTADPELASQVAAVLATLAVDEADGSSAAAWCEAALDLAPTRTAPASAMHLLATAHALNGDLDVGLAAVDRRVQALRAMPGAPADARADAASARALLRLCTHDLDGAAHDLEASLTTALAGSSFVARETSRCYLAAVRYRQGRWDDALVLAERAASLIDDSDQPWMGWLPHATAAQVAAARGGEAGDHLERARRSSAMAGRGLGPAVTRAAAIEVAACQRDDKAVLELADELRRAPWRVDERVAGWRANAVRALAADGRLDDARVLLAELEATPGSALVANDAARAALAVAVASDDADAADAAAELGLRLDPDAVGSYPRARLELAAGRAWRRRGERRRAVRVLEQALARFRALGAVRWAEQVEREISASGLRPSRGAARVGEGLTPQERAVAELVARGLTNREVAAELVVSAKTVEHHLSRIYSKLGVRSRTELAIALSGP
jgi:ATP/maltotriose-dependent transcriptional regulator MalT